MSNPGIRIFQTWPRPDKELIERFRGKAAANVCDCMGRLFATDASIRPMGKTRAVVGPALTVRAAVSDNLLIHKAILMAQPGDVIVVNAFGDMSHAVIGDIMFRAAQSRGVAGFVIDGCIRDLDWLMENDFPVYARGVTPAGPYKNGLGEIGSDIAVGNQVVHPGDIILGDTDGLVVIGPADAELVLEKTEKLIENERLSGELIQNGKWSESALVQTIESVLQKQGFDLVD